MKKTNTTIKKLIAMMMIIAVLAGLAACGAADPNGTTNATDNATDSEQMQATGSVATTEGDKQGESTTGQPVDGTSGTSEAADPSTSADPTTEPGTEKTEPGTQPTEPSETQPTQPQPTDPPHQHDYSNTTVVAPTCNDKGYTKHTCACGDSYKDNYTDALGHHFIDEVVAPTSSEQGYTKHTCDRCWYSYKDNYTDPVKMVIDINKAMELGNAYALSLGFACIDYSLTPANAGYYPPGYIESDSLARLGGQEWLEGEIIGQVQACKDNLEGIYGEGTHNGCICRAYIIYDATEDAYTIYFLYV